MRAATPPFSRKFPRRLAYLLSEGNLPNYERSTHVTAHARVILPKDFVRNNPVGVPDILSEGPCGLFQSLQAKAASLRTVPPGQG